MSIETAPDSYQESPLLTNESSTPEVTRDQVELEVQPIVDETNSIASKNGISESLDKDTFPKKVSEQKDTANGIKVLHNLGLFPESNTWKEIGQKTNEFGKKAQKEMLYLQLLGGLGAVALLEPTPLGELAFGVSLSLVGKNSEVVKKLLGEENIEKVSNSKITSAIAEALKKKSIV